MFTQSQMDGGKVSLTLCSPAPKAGNLRARHWHYTDEHDDDDDDYNPPEDVGKQKRGGECTLSFCFHYFLQVCILTSYIVQEP